MNAAAVVGGFAAAVRVVPVAIAIALLLAASAVARPVVGVWERFSYIPSVNPSGSPTTPSKGPSSALQNMTVRIYSWETGAAFPLVFRGGRTAIRNRLEYLRTDFTYGEWDPATRGGRDIRRVDQIEYKAYIVHELSAEWKALVYVAPGFASDFDHFDTKQCFAFSGIIGGMRRMSDALTLGTGFTYGHDFGRPLILPILYFKWRATDRLLVKGLLPKGATVVYSVHPAFDCGVVAEAEGDRYHVDPVRYGVENPQMDLAQATVGPYATVHFSKWIHFRVAGGFTVMREWKFRNGSRTIHNLDLQNTVFLSAGLEVGLTP
jgi:hypothetical protein